MDTFIKPNYFDLLAGGELIILRALNKFVHSHHSCLWHTQGGAERGEVEESVLNRFSYRLFASPLQATLWLYGRNDIGTFFYNRWYNTFLIKCDFAQSVINVSRETFIRVEKSVAL